MQGTVCLAGHHQAGRRRDQERNHELSQVGSDRPDEGELCCHASLHLCSCIVQAHAIPSACLLLGYACHAQTPLFLNNAAECLPQGGAALPAGSPAARKLLQGPLTAPALYVPHPLVPAAGPAPSPGPGVAPLSNPLFSSYASCAGSLSNASCAGFTNPLIPTDFADPGETSSSATVQGHQVLMVTAGETITDGQPVVAGLAASVKGDHQHKCVTLPCDSWQGSGQSAPHHRCWHVASFCTHAWQLKRCPLRY